MDKAEIKRLIDTYNANYSAIHNATDGGLVADRLALIATVVDFMGAEKSAAETGKRGGETESIIIPKASECKPSETLQEALDFIG